MTTTYRSDDTPTVRRAVCTQSPMVEDMRKRRRPDGTPTGVLNVRISADLPSIVREAADRNGITDSYYVDLLIAELVKQHDGHLPDVDVPTKHHEELPIQFAA